MEFKDFKTLVSVALSKVEGLHPVTLDFWTNFENIFKENEIADYTESEAKEYVRQYFRGLVKGIELRRNNNMWSRIDNFPQALALGLEQGFLVKELEDMTNQPSYHS